MLHINREVNTQGEDGQSELNGGVAAIVYAAPIGAFFCPEIRALTGFWGEFSSTVSKVLSDRKVLFKHKNGH